MSSAMVATNVGLCRPTPREATSATTTMAVPSLPRSTGTLVVVAYEDGWYLGEVAETGSNGHLHVRFMKKGAKDFSWTSRCDLIHENFILGVSPLIAPCDSSCRLITIENEHEIAEAYAEYGKKYFCP